ncbi:hypothetical protein NX801_00545 [Streptomyces sp. LP05-1]|uniref:Hydrogenase expression protein HypF n=1 Tax=Streptomyces pyxinae TaxID=2970734 RepID=A0ABT2C9Z1_9ACTN|nr:hypothetical protein [Streptomyces sp. LP05-1]MCS0634176.1 hypothetical protein [Streptomyces sp. LP05-1]
MRGEEARQATGGRGRHAAPRKSLLAKLQSPAGKAMALAAMPTAVLVGMGLTPRLALADEKDIPFAPGPCVTRSDEPAPEKSSGSPAPSPSASASSAAKPAPDRSPDPSESRSPAPSTSPQAGKPEPKPTPSAPSSSPSASDTAPAPDSPAPTPTRTRDPLDPLGLGDALRDIFDGPDDSPAATPATKAPAPKAPTTKAPAAAVPSTGKQSTERPAGRQGEKTPQDEPESEPETDSPKGAGKETPAEDAAKHAIEDAAGKAGRAVEELPEGAKGLDPREDADIPEGAKPRFPCPSPDPKALAEAEPEPGIPLVPDDPWKLESTKLTLNGLDYKGIVEVRTAGGELKKVLKFTASSLEIDNLHQMTVHSEGRTGHVTSRPGSTSTIEGGTVTMYTEELKGNLFGFLPITFSPSSPPPLNVPYAFFTSVKVTQAAQFGGTLTIPGLHNYIEG